MTTVAIFLSKAFIAMLMVLLLAGQLLLLPVYSLQALQEYPELGFLWLPFLVLGILTLLCAQIVLAGVWALLSMVRNNVIFNARAFAYVNLMIGALLAAALMVLAVLVTLGVAASAGPPGLVIPGIAVIMACAGLALILFVMRSLLMKATRDSDYLAEVV